MMVSYPAGPNTPSTITVTESCYSRMWNFLNIHYSLCPPPLQSNQAFYSYRYDALKCGNAIKKNHFLHWRDLSPHADTHVWPCPWQRKEPLIKIMRNWFLCLAAKGDKNTLPDFPLNFYEESSKAINSSWHESHFPYNSTYKNLSMVDELNIK